VTPAEQRTLTAIRTELGRLARYDDESVVHDNWIRQRYQGGYAATYAPGRQQAVVTAWHEAGRSSGRVHSIAASGPDGFLIAAAGQVAEGLRGWTLPSSDAELRAWLTAWRDDGGDARRFRAGLAGTPFAGSEAAAWRHAVDALTPQRPRIRELARGLLAWPRYLPYAVAAGLAGVG
jgi:hypothetical protein